MIRPQGQSDWDKSSKLISPAAVSTYAGSQASSMGDASP